MKDFYEHFSSLFWFLFLMDVRTVRDDLIAMHRLLLPQELFPALLSFTETLKGLIFLSWQLLREP